MNPVEVIEQLTALTKAQADIIERQSKALMQLGAAVELEARSEEHE